MKFSVLVVVRQDAGGLADCLFSLQKLKVQAGEAETILVGSATDLTAAGKGAVRSGAAGQLVGTRARLSEAIRTARGDLIAFLDSDTIVHPEWLARIDAEAADKTIGCLAGDILPLNPVTAIEKFLAASFYQSQRWAVSGWHFKPYALFGNAVYRRSAIEGLEHATLNGLECAETTLAWHMLDRTDLKIKFVPEAIVYRRSRSKLEDFWSHFRNQGRSHVNWLLRQSDYSLPSVAQLEESACAEFNALVDGAEEQIAQPALKAAMQTAVLSGHLQRMVEAALPGVALDSASIVLRECSARCCICGSTRFVPGPRGRMVGTVAPQCAECSSLERHRVLHSLLLVMDPEECKKWSALAIGEPLHRKLRVFDRHHSATLDQLASEDHSGTNYDVAIGTFALSPNARSMEEVLSLTTRPLRESGMLVLVDLPPAPPSRAAGSEQPVSTEIEYEISKRLPNATVRNVWSVDHVTETAFIVTLAAQNTAQVSRLVSRYCWRQISSGRRSGENTVKAN